MTRSTAAAANRNEIADDTLPARVTTLEESLRLISQQLSGILRFQEEAAQRSNGGKGSSANGERRNGGDRSHEVGPGPFFAIKGRKLEMPIFNGTDPDGWILRADRYCQLNRLKEEEKLEVAIISLEGDALRWFQWENKRRVIVTWEEFKRLLLIQFRSVGEGSLCEQFLAVKQETTVKEYKRLFVEKAAPLEGISEEVYISQFINGLIPEIRAEIRLLAPNGLNKAMEIASMIEERNRAVNKSRWSKGSVPFKKFGDNNQEEKTIASSIVKSGNGKMPEFRKLTDKELQLRRAQGLCYRCDEKYAPGHRCKRRELSVLVMQEEDDDHDQETELSNLLQEGEIEVSLNSIVGISTPKTMKLQALVGEQQVVVLIDSGASHNFISLDLVEKLGLPIQETRAYSISMGAGEGIRSKGLCKKVKVWMQGIEIEQEFLPIQLSNSDLILGIQWLQTLGTMQVNWSTQVMKFEWGNEYVKLKGLPFFEASWESFDKVQDGFPDFNLEDKVKVWKGGNDENRFGRIYSRRKGSNKDN